jgi:hypothetical protein
VKRSGIQRSALKRAPRKGRFTGIKKFFGRFKKVNSLQHSLMPARKGAGHARPALGLPQGDR